MSYDSTQDDRLWAMLSYVLSLFFPIIAPLVVFLVKKDSSKFIGFHSLQALLLHAGVAVAWIAYWVLAAIMGAIHLGLLALPLLLLMLVVNLVAFVLIIVGAIKSYGGEWYEMPVVGKIARQQVGV